MAMSYKVKKVINQVTVCSYCPKLDSSYNWPCHLQIQTLFKPLK